MKDLSYLAVFSQKSLREARRIIAKGFTLKDINDYLHTPEEHPVSPEMEAELRRNAKTAEKMGWKRREPCKKCKDEK